jgi:hypothetical protein
MAHAKVMIPHRLYFQPSECTCFPLYWRAEVEGTRPAWVELTTLSGSLRLEVAVVRANDQRDWLSNNGYRSIEREKGREWRE